MRKKSIKHIYGPISSWRLGRSLGIDPVYTGRGKICSFDCIYCQVGMTCKLTDRRKKFVPTAEIIEEVRSLPRVKIDYITFSGAGEPTLAKNLGRIIREIKKLRPEKIAVFTNASIMDRKDVQRDLMGADFVIAKLDSHSQTLLGEMNKPSRKVKIENILDGIKSFKKRFKGRFALQIMFTKKNKKYANLIAELAQEIAPDEVQINTPLRHSPVKPLSQKEINRIKLFFKGLKTISVYNHARKKKVKPLNRHDIIKRRGAT